MYRSPLVSPGLIDSAQPGLRDTAHGELRQAMPGHYLPLTGRHWWTGWPGPAPRARITAGKMFTFAMPD
ncbi:MAG TPA: hypothetical protein VFV41_17150 [Streptosporangiaceae bacterium]|nr:hypothetical protein [Streptosporangiaceae bacterium]